MQLVANDRITYRGKELPRGNDAVQVRVINKEGKVWCYIAALVLSSHQCEIRAGEKKRKVNRVRSTYRMLPYSFALVSI